MSARIIWRAALLCILICVLGVFSATRYGDDLIRKIVGDRETVNHARVLIEADLVTKLDELLGSLSLHQKLVALNRQLANEPSSSDSDVEFLWCRRWRSCSRGRKRRVWNR